MKLSEVQKEAFAHAVNKGFHPPHIVNGDHSDIHYMATRIALIHSEASESLEVLRTNPLDEEHFIEELADIIIRVADLAEVAGLDLASAVFNKIEKNKTRPYQHGGRTL